MGKRKCIGCKDRFDASEMRGHPASVRLSCKQQSCQDALVQFILLAVANKKKKEYNARTKVLKAECEPRRKLYTRLGKLVNQYAKHVLYKDDPCYTCNKKQKPGDNGGAFHAGHCFPAGQVDPRRFMAEINIRIQCYSCNCKNSGRADIFKARLKEELGAEVFEFLSLEANHPKLKVLFPVTDDIRAEIDLYREKLRSKGLQPRV